MASQLVILTIPWCQEGYKLDLELLLGWISLWSAMYWELLMANLSHFLLELKAAILDPLRSLTEFQWHFHFSLALSETKLLNTRR